MSLPVRAICALMLALLTLPAQHAVGPTAPPKERVVYGVEWRLIHAGTVTVEARPTEVSMKLESAGLVTSLFKVNDSYTATYDEPFCATSIHFDAQEGKRHREYHVAINRPANRAHIVE